MFYLAWEEPVRFAVDELSGLIEGRGIRSYDGIELQNDGRTEISITSRERHGEHGFHHWYSTMVILI